MASLKPLSAKALACARLPSAGAPRTSSRILAAPPLRSAAGRAQATSRVVQAAESPRVSFARAKVHAAQSIARRPEPTEAATEPKLKVSLKSIGAKVASLLKPKPAPLQPLATYILPDGVLSPEADPSSSSGLARLKALGLRLHSRFSTWMDQVVYECKELRALIRYGPSRGRLPAPALTPQQAALARAQEEEVFRLSDTPPVPRTVAAMAGPKPPRRGSRLAALLRRLLRLAAALLTPRKAVAQQPSTTSSTSAGASSAAAESAAGAGAAEVLDTSPSLPVSLHASTADESDMPFAATTAPVAAAAHEIADDDDWVRRVWARAAADAAADAGSTGSSTAGSSRRQSFVSGSSCEPAAAAVGSSRNNTSSGGLSSLSASDSAGTATSASADTVTAADYALVEPAGADEVDEEEEADGSSSNNEDTTHYSQLARYASSSSSSAPSDDDSESGGENVEDAGSRRHQKQGRRAAMSGKAGHGARVGAWVAASRAAAAGSGGLKQQRRRQEVAVAASGYQLVKMARPATAAVYDGGLMG
ncbi:hypothetical protein CHLRE_14g624050v5 [Chlamydomonas reinhardtii]|uniref:Uncharacterized protein n=1 Tax=Chlamydomonas reinhardtii TaxID=3055 RepID=A0A2K3CY73_CHLRE|nr:uncharacterized protein CHLRE_14g624050v5 [Chlamydomonas reinhardtii]PNW73233.1 hypothetical protein CHLRE_14g624050v5 [Chlamydomonas reinhardtii]